MKLKVIACEILLRETCRAAVDAKPILDIAFKPYGLHSTPEELRVTLQAEIDATPPEFDAIVLGYGLCSRGTAGLIARSVPLVIPRAHDCITLLLGSKERYQEEFFAHPGTYYYSSGWIERSEGKIDQSTTESAKEADRERRYQEYVEKFGEDNAKYLIELEGSWLAHYSRAAYIELGIGDSERYREFTQRIASDQDWGFRELAGDLRLFHQLVSGEWSPEDFLVVPPGQTIADTNDPRVVEAR